MKSANTFFSYTFLPAIAAFLTYFCMYCFRKPFSAATYEEITFWGLNYKSSLVIMQVLGYMAAKFWGIKFISEMKPEKRNFAIIGLIAFSEIALLAFAFLPLSLKPFAMFFNGFPLGLIWGLVFSFIEGRRNTEILGSFMAVSFIVSSGISKTFGRLLITDFQLDIFWMPFIVGLIIFPILLFSTWLLQKIPLPNEADKVSRTLRSPMTFSQRKSLFFRYIWGISGLVLVYIFLNAYRDFRDNFILEIWTDLGYGNSPAILTTAEIPIMLIVLLITALTVLIKNNYKAFIINHLLIIFSSIIIVISTFLFQMGIINPVVWMILVGIGMYLAYIIFQCIIFERFIATFREAGNVGFLMYIADAFGYLGSISVLIYKEFFFKDLQWLNFFIQSSYVVALLMFATIIFTWYYFSNKYNQNKPSTLLIPSL